MFMYEISFYISQCNLFALSTRFIHLKIILNNFTVIQFQQDVKIGAMLFSVSNSTFFNLPSVFEIKDKVSNYL